ncbi:hypothetical protein SDC9_165395 [bioreactor metagenome]|uniref:Uncharacterized protein n=1 Tax=bioreactor metagenome TaxID=1076179 RepID=A0A645FU74_9ZZZZ
MFGRDVTCVAVELDEVGRAQGRRSEEVIERPRRRAVALVADGLIGDHGEVVELGFQTKLVKKIDLDFHRGILKWRSKHIGGHYHCFPQRKPGWIVRSSVACSRSSGRKPSQVTRAHHDCNGNGRNQGPA